MSRGLFIIYCLYVIAVIIAAVIGFTRYKKLQPAMRIIAWLLLLTSVSELCSYIATVNEKYELRYTIYHFYNVVEAFVITAYFIYAIRPIYYRKLMIANAILWPSIGIANAVWLQPLHTLNSNMLMLESFSFITMSLYSIYHILRDDTVDNIFNHPHFRIAAIFLISWGSTFFFWAFIKILYRHHWPYMDAAVYMQAIISILVCVGIAITLFISSKKKIYE